MKKNILLACLFLSLAPFACKKKDDPTPAPTPTTTTTPPPTTTNPPPTTMTKSEILIAKTWKITSMTFMGMDMTSEMEPCEKDDVQNFKTDGTYKYTDAGIKCDTVGDAVGKWKLITNETMFVMDEDTFKVEELTSTTFRSSVIEMGMKAEITMTAQK
jgi:hypothetical protein